MTVDREELLAVLNLKSDELNEVLEGEEIDYLIGLVEEDLKNNNGK